MVDFRKPYHVELNGAKHYVRIRFAAIVPVCLLTLLKLSNVRLSAYA